MARDSFLMSFSVVSPVRKNKRTNFLPIFQGSDEVWESFLVCLFFISFKAFKAFRCLQTLMNTGFFGYNYDIYGVNYDIYGVNYDIYRV